MNKLYERLDSKEPKYSLKYKEMISSIARLGDVSITTGTRDEQFERGRAFAYVYEYYMYSIILGMKKELRVPIESKDSSKFLRLGDWKPKEMARYVTTISIGYTDFELMELEDADDETINMCANQVVQVMEEYANGGLEYFYQLWKENRELYVDPTKLVLELMSN